MILNRKDIVVLIDTYRSFSSRLSLDEEEEPLLDFLERFKSLNLDDYLNKETHYALERKGFFWEGTGFRRISDNQYIETRGKVLEQTIFNVLVYERTNGKISAEHKSRAESDLRISLENVLYKK